jgi:hypothetical protein
MKTKRKERICPGCEITFIPEKSNKQAHCGPACKDKSNSRKRNHRDHLMNKQLAKYRENYNTLRLFEAHDTVIVTDKELANLNFDFDYLPAANYDKDELYFPFGKISMYLTKHSYIYQLKFQK